MADIIADRVKAHELVFEDVRRGIGWAGLYASLSFMRARHPEVVDIAGDQLKAHEVVL